MIQIILDFLGIGPVSDEIAFIFGTILLIYLLAEFMNFIWSLYKAVFRHG